MRTRFTAEHLADPDIAASEKILRKCVHCGFCTATCPTYLLLGDERDSPRGRIVLIQDMLERQTVPDPETVLHLDRCLSCLGCMTTCPSGVTYMHLIDHARSYIHDNYRRSLFDRWMRWFLGRMLPSPNRFGFMMALANLAKPFAGFLPSRLRAAVHLAPSNLHGPQALERPGRHAAAGETKRRVALLLGCVQRRLAPEHAEAALRVLTRFGAEVTVPADLGCCGALNHHLGESDAGRDHARRNIAAVKAAGPFDHVVAIASGCGTMIKDYGFLMHGEAEAEAFSKSSADVTEVLSQLNYRGNGTAPRLKVAYHPACSLEHGQNLKALPRDLLRAAGFDLVEIPNSHLCCGSAGTYNLLQPEIAAHLRDQKIAAIHSTGADVVAAGNIGCLTQLRDGLDIPIVHTVELLDWASGGPKPCFAPRTA